MKKRLLSLVLLASVALTTACGNSAQTNDVTSADASAQAAGLEEGVTASSDDALNIAVSIDFNKVDTIVAYGTEIDLLVNAVSEGLFYYAEDSSVQPFLVSSYTQPDATTYVYEIREDVTFSDGTALTAEDVAFSLNRHLDESNGSYLAWMFESVASIEQTGDYEVTVKLDKPDPAWEYTLATPAGDVISKAYYEAHSDNFGTSDGGFIGSGPYVITSWDAAEINLEYNENYWNSAETEPGFEQINFLSIPDQSVVKSALEAGTIDFTQNISLDTAKELDEKGIVNINATDYLGSTFVSFNTNVEPLNDVRVRQAIAYAIDKEIILSDIIGQEYASIGKSQLFSSNIGNAYQDLWSGYFDNENAYEYNIEKAKELLAEAGYENGFDISLTYLASDSTEENVVLYIQQNLSEIGINATLVGVDGATSSTLRYGGSETRDYQLFLTNWASDYPDPVGTIIPMYYSTNNVAGGSNWAEYNSSEFDSLLDQSSVASSKEERIEILSDALTVLENDIPYAPIYNNYKIFATSSRVDYTFSTMLMYNIYLKDIHRAQ